jgi:threonylcarbamoyladenosine tRNA methylthiotransferase MtaB
LKEASIDLAIGNNKKKELLPILTEYIESREICHSAIKPDCSKEVPVADRKTLDRKTIIDISCETEYEEMSLSKPPNRRRIFIKIQDGCNQFCSYCIIPYVRGRARSRAAEAILAEVTGLVNEGCREIVLSGINISSYGSEFREKDALLNLLTKLSALPDLKFIHLGSLEPRLITYEFATGLAALPKVCPHFHVSLQSGCDATLKRMNRHYTTSEYYEKIKILRDIFKEPVITTDIIVGFPGETAAEFAETEHFIKRVSFTKIHVFPYSKRKGTVAATLPDQISAAVKKMRSNRLLQQ